MDWSAAGVTGIALPPDGPVPGPRLSFDRRKHFYRNLTRSLETPAA